MGAGTRWIRCVAAVFGLAAFAHSGSAATVGVAEAWAIAQAAYARGDMVMANTMARGLSKARPDEAEIFVLLAATEAKLGRGDEARAAGRQAYQLAEDRQTRQRAAFVSSRAAVADDRYTAAQWWLRRAYQLAEGDEERAQVARAFQQVRNRNPWSMNVNFSMAPTSNINGGTDSEFLVIDDQITGGTIGAGSRTLSGVRTTASVDLSYRLSQGEAHRTEVALHALRTWNRLDDDVSGVDSSDFDYGLAELKLTHFFAGLPAPLPDRASIAIGQVWSGGDPYERVGRISLSRRFRLGEKTSLRVTGEAERRLSDQGRQDRDGTKLRFDLSRKVGQGVARLSIGQTDVRSDNMNWDYTEQSVRLSYTQTEGIAGIRLSGSVGWREKVYDTHSSGFMMPVTERRDESQSAQVSAHMDRFAVMGFAPVITYSAERTDSNFSLYERRSYGWSLGLRSSF